MSNNKYSNFTTRQLFEELEKEDASDIHQGERPALDAERVSKMIASNQSLVSALKSVNNAKELEHTLEVIFSHVSVSPVTTIAVMRRLAKELSGV